MTGHVTEAEVYLAFGEIVNKLVLQRPEVVVACEAVLNDLLSTVDLDQKKAKLEAEQKRITERVEALMGQASRELMEDFSEAYGRLEAEMNRVSGKLDAAEREKGEREYKERQCRLFLKTLQSITLGENESWLVDSDLFLALVDKVIVENRLRFILRDGSEWMV